MVIDSHVLYWWLDGHHGLSAPALRAIEAVTTLPLVLHGGSGIDPAVRRMLSRQHRVKKFNVGTEIRQAFGASVRATLAQHPHSFDRLEILRPTIAAQREAALRVIRNLGPG